MDTDELLYEITSHIEGKNAKVRVYRDRIEWERPKSFSAGKMTAAAMTFGMSAAVTGGVKGRKGAGTEVIPMKFISSVSTRRDTMLNDIVSVITTGNTIDMRCSKSEAEQLKALILDGIMGRLEVAPAQAVPAYAGAVQAAPVYASSPTPPPPPPAKPADWYADPQGAPGLLRYWDGMQWTEHTHEQ